MTPKFASDYWIIRIIQIASEIGILFAIADRDASLVSETIICNLL